MAILSFVTQKGSNFTLKESIAYPKRDFTSHLCTKEWETTHQLNIVDKTIERESEIEE